MGAPKQKWTAEEEAALKAGIRKYGVGKWSTILKDPEFSTVLRARSNVDLKDKFRNLNCLVNGLGSRNRARVSIRTKQTTPKHEEKVKIRTLVVKKNPEVRVITPLAASVKIPVNAVPKKQISRLDESVLEAIAKLKEPRGSTRPAIVQYIEELYLAPPELERAVAANLKILTENGQLIKVKNHYRIAPRSNEAKKDPFEPPRNTIVLLTKAQIDAELEKMKGMTAEEAAAAAAQAVAEAEAAIAEAEAAAREAEEAEAEAEAAQCFAEAAQKAVNGQTIRVW
ncbi:hypothetical protein ACJIZ3_014964 [Penstemon smallii]|uniref:MYB transcription factor n=1 Tax=Penstemon smallii TaxID=265156 RepID=A0ABD3RP87_9LAMI